MASLKELKGRINSVKSTQKITKAKQMVAAAKLRRAQAAAEAGRPYATRLAAVMASLAGKVSGSITARELVILKTAHIEGDVHYDALTIEQGAAVDGRFAPNARTAVKAVPSSVEAAE